VRLSRGMSTFLSWDGVILRLPAMRGLGRK
jgi:hypothetical protein